MSVRAPVCLTCPHCKVPGPSRVVDTRGEREGRYVRRRRKCKACGQRYSTTEAAVATFVSREDIQKLADEMVAVLREM